MLLLSLIALSILPFTQSCAPTVTPDFIDYGTLQTTTTTSPMCIAGYTLQADGNCYKFVNVAVDQPTAQMACQADGANLAPIRTDQQRLIVEALTGGTSIWIGIIRIVTGTCPGVVNDCFGTIDDNQPLGYSYWVEGQGGGSDSEQCVATSVSLPDGIWDDIPCAGGSAYPYVCMIAPAAG